MDILSIWIRFRMFLSRPRRLRREEHFFVSVGCCSWKQTPEHGRNDSKTFKNKLILPLTQKKSHLSFFAFRISRFWEKALDFQTLIGQFGLKYFPRFWRHLKKILINEKVNKKTSFAHFLHFLIKKEFVYTF